MLTEAQLKVHLDAVIDDINGALNAVFPTLSAYGKADYDCFPDRYIRSVLIIGAAFKFYVTDEEGIATAQQYQMTYQNNLFYMARDYSNNVPFEYVADKQGYLTTHPEFLHNVGAIFQGLCGAPVDMPINPDIRYVEGPPGRPGPPGPQGEPGYTPQRGVDYGTPEDVAEIKSYAVKSERNLIDSSSIRLYGVKNNQDVFEAPRSNTSLSEADANAGINNTTYDRFLEKDVYIYQSTIMRRDGNGRCSILAPIYPKHIANKEYVDSIAGDIETALDRIIAIQNGLIGGGTV